MISHVADEVIILRQGKMVEKGPVGQVIGQPQHEYTKAISRGFSMSVLQIQNVSKSFGNLRAVDDVSISLEQGDNLAIIGESGCGKTTLAKMIMGLITPDAGIHQGRST